MSELKRIEEQEQKVDRNKKYQDHFAYGFDEIYSLFIVEI